jgi:L-aspartate oxidase
VRNLREESRSVDFLIIGSGIAGLRAAVDLANYGTVTILTKADPTESNTGYAQGGIAAAIGVDDSPEEHFADTMAAGDGLCDEDAVRVLVEDGVLYVRELLEWGAAFDRDPTGQPVLGREGAHRVRRVVHARDATGREIERLLWSRVMSHSKVRVMNHARAVSMILRDGRCVGAEYRQPAGAAALEAGAVLLATGGAGQVFAETTNPTIATGDGIALAWRAGARVADLEFVQFHPTALAVTGAPRFLLSEALRGEGAWLVNSDGERFMQRYERAGELASRDLVARAMVSEIARTGSPVFISMQHLDPHWVHARFPTIAAACQSVGLDLARDLIPVSPAAHYIMGGVETDVWGRTTLAGLYAAGEVACTGREPTGQQFPARGPGVWRACREGDAGASPPGRHDQRPRHGRRFQSRSDTVRRTAVRARFALPHVAVGRRRPRRPGVVRRGAATASLARGARRTQCGAGRRCRRTGREHRHCRMAHRQSGIATNGVTRWPLPRRFSAARRSTLEDSCSRAAAVVGARHASPIP